MNDITLPTSYIIKQLLAHYGPECLDWEPEVLQKTLSSDFNIAKVNLYKALAGLAILQQDRFWSDWHTFHFLAQAFNNTAPSAGLVQELSIGQMMLAVHTANNLRKELGPLSYTPVYSEEIAKFIAAQALNQGVWFLPEPLLFASKYASKTVLHCNDCKNEEYVDEESEPSICPVCTAKYDTTSLSSFTPNEQRLKLGFGKNVVTITKHPTAGVQKYLHKFLVTGDVTVDDTNPDQVCALKLLIAIKYFNDHKGLI